MAETSKDEEELAQNIKSIHEDVRKKIEARNVKYKEATDHIRRQQLFTVGDLVWVHMWKEWSPIRTYNKLIGRKIGLCQVQQMINDNAYTIELLDHVRTSDVFNVEDLTPFKEEAPVAEVIDSEDDANSRASSSRLQENDSIWKITLSA